MTSVVGGRLKRMTCRIRLIPKKGSRACKAVVEGTGLRRYVGSKYQTDVLVNYGLSGQKLLAFYRKFPSAKRIPTINKQVGFSKLRVVNITSENGIPTPESKMSLNRKDKLNEWIEKRFHSQGGAGICKARNKDQMAHKYYQKFVSDRVSELRVHGFKWIDPDNWRIQRRRGEEDEIAWNYSKGGRFISINRPSVLKDCREAIKITDTILDILNMGFGAVDFIVDSNRDVWFIEINSCPGFQELSKDIYIDAFEKLKTMKPRDILKLTY